MMLRAVLIDDERPARRELRTLLGAHPEVEVVGEAADMASGADLVAQRSPDVAFLDIELGSASGFALLPAFPAACRVVFVTAFDEYAVRAFAVNAVDYLLKPVHPERLAATLGRLVAPPHPAHEVVFLSCGSASAFVELRSIVCVLAEGDYTRVVTRDGRERLMLRSLHEWEQRLPAGLFARVHRSAVVNLGAITRTTPIVGGRMRLEVSPLAKPLLASRRFARQLRSRV
jgi:two-component system LytT family response regulator